MAQFYNRVTATVTCEIARFVMIRVPYKNVSSQHFGSHWTVKKDFWINNDFLTPFFRGPQMSHCVMYCSPDPSPLCHADLLISGPPYPVTSHCNRDIYCVGGGSLISNTSHPRKCVVSAPLNFITYDTNNHEQHPHTHEKHHQNHYSEPLAASGHNMVANTPPKVAAWALAPSPATTQVAVAKKTQEHLHYRWLRQQRLLRDTARYALLACATIGLRYHHLRRIEAVAVHHHWEDLSLNPFHFKHHPALCIKALVESCIKQQPIDNVAIKISTHFSFRSRSST